MSDPIEITTAQSFELERFSRDLDDCKNVDELRKIAKQLLQLWMGQKAAALWVMRQRHSPLPEQPAPDSPQGHKR